MHSVFITSNTSWYLYNFRKNTIISLIRSGYTVSVIAPKDNYSVKLIELGVYYYEIRIDQGGKNPYKDLLSLISFLKIYSRNKVDVVLNFTPKNNIYSTLAARFFNIPVINNIAGLGYIFISETISSKIARLLYRCSQRYASKIFFQNDDDRKLFLDSGIACSQIAERIPGSGADLSRFSLSPAKDDSVVRFLLIARMLYDKGIEYYVEAARILKRKYGNSVEFRLLGFLDVSNPSAVSKAQMQSWVDEGIVSYLGVSDKVEDEIAQVDCMVLPSFYREGVPKSLLEAGAMGKPIVTTDNVGCRETVDDGINGFLCEPRSTSSLVVALDKMILMTHQQRLTMGEASRRKIETEFDERIVIQKYLDAIEEVMK